MCSLLNYMGLCPLPRKFLISKWWGFVHSRWYYLLFRCLFYTQKWCLWSSKTNIFLQNIMQPTYLFNRNKKRTLVAYTCKKDTKCHKYFQIADISAAVFLASECIMLLMSVAAWCPFANQLFTYFTGWKFNDASDVALKSVRDKIIYRFPAALCLSLTAAFVISVNGTLCSCLCRYICITVAGPYRSHNACTINSAMTRTYEHIGKLGLRFKVRQFLNRPIRSLRPRRTNIYRNDATTVYLKQTKVTSI